MLVCALALFASGCASVDPILAQGLYWAPLAASLVFAAGAIGGSRRRAWLRALKDWAHPAAPQPDKGWVSLVVVGAVFLWFALYVLYWIDIPIPPEVRWGNVGAWLGGSVLGGLIGWSGGKSLATRQFQKLFPGRTSTE